MYTALCYRNTSYSVNKCIIGIPCENTNDIDFLNIFLISFI